MWKCWRSNLVWQRSTHFIFSACCFSWLKRINHRLFKMMFSVGKGTFSSLSIRFIAAAAAKSLQSCPTLCDPIDGSPPGSSVWDSPGKNTGVGCHFLLQYMKVKSESAVAQSCLTLSDPMDCSPPGSSVHGILEARVLEWGAIAFSEYRVQGINILRGNSK